MRLIKRLADMLPAVKSFRSNDFDFMIDDGKRCLKSKPLQMLVEKSLKNLKIDMEILSSNKLYDLFTETKNSRLLCSNLFMMQARK